MGRVDIRPPEGYYDWPEEQQPGVDPAASG